MVVYIQFIIYLFVNPLFKFLFRPIVKGAENFPKKPFIIAVNHSSKLDAFMFFLLPFWEGKKIIPLHFLTLESYHKRWYFDLFLRMVGSFPVRGRAWTLEDYLSESVELVKSGKVLIFFPEGGIVRNNIIKPPRPGIGYLTKMSEKPVVPLRIEWTGARFGKTKLKMTFGKPIFPFTGEESLLEYQIYAQKVMDIIYSL